MFLIPFSNCLLTWDMHMKGWAMLFHLMHQSVWVVLVWNELQAIKVCNFDCLSNTQFNGLNILLHLIFAQMCIRHCWIVFFCTFWMCIFMLVLVQHFQNKECVMEVEKIKRSALMIHHFWNLRVSLAFDFFLFSQLVKCNFCHTDCSFCVSALSSDVFCF